MPEKPVTQKKIGAANGNYQRVPQHGIVTSNLTLSAALVTFVSLIAVLCASGWLALLFDIETLLFVNGWIDYICSSNTTYAGIFFEGALRNAVLVNGSHWFFMSLAMTLPLLIVSLLKPNTPIRLSDHCESKIPIQVSWAAQVNLIALLFFLTGIVIFALTTSLCFAFFDLASKLLLYTLGFDREVIRVVYAIAATMCVILIWLQASKTKRCGHHVTFIGNRYSSGLTRRGAAISYLRFGKLGVISMLQCAKPCWAWMFVLLFLSVMELHIMALITAFDVAMYVAALHRVNPSGAIEAK
jgi:hypothetical protein